MPNGMNYQWTYTDRLYAVELMDAKTPMDELVRKLGRSEASIVRRIKQDILRPKDMSICFSRRALYLYTPTSHEKAKKIREKILWTVQDGIAPFDAIARYNVSKARYYRWRSRYPDFARQIDGARVGLAPEQATPAVIAAKRTEEQKRTRAEYMVQYRAKKGVGTQEDWDRRKQDAEYMRKTDRIPALIARGLTKTAAVKLAGVDYPAYRLRVKYDEAYADRIAGKDLLITEEDTYDEVLRKRRMSKIQADKAMVAACKEDQYLRVQIKLSQSKIDAARETLDIHERKLARYLERRAVLDATIRNLSAVLSMPESGEVDEQPIDDMLT